jgi:hypothetical protein
MNLQIQKALKDKRLLKAIIGMSKKEFEQLLKRFAPLVMRKPYKKNRKRRPGAGRNTHWTLRKRNHFLF